MLKIIAIIGARPQFIKHAPIDLYATSMSDIQLFTIHTGQHYDKNMSDVFFNQLKMSKPDIILEIGSHNHGKQTGLMMIEIERITETECPDAILVYGDTNSTLAGALVAAKLHIPLIHIEAGLRSFNKDMPEEINRILTDQVSSLLFVPNKNAIEQLKKEGIIAPAYETGDIMFDLFKRALEVIKDQSSEEDYYLATIHRPYNTDKIERLKEILHEMNHLKYKVKFPAHPRTMNLLKNQHVDINEYQNIMFLAPQGYFEMMGLLKNCRGLITDSGGMQKEAYWMKKKCVTLRSETEWVETLENNWNTLVFDNLSTLKTALEIEPGEYNPTVYGDGNAAGPIMETIKDFLLNKKTA
ncbi:MAG: UDP-N-acetylglucosamine 2-epimerase (non-hydrolyzing) [Chitinophagales bacterium]|nr:UDP-N-acetylglucosamine 2-epimerase (non-hydrolyzing) [Chitinophagales bacterium]